jgi:hypothetical protein
MQPTSRRASLKTGTMTETNGGSEVKNQAPPGTRPPDLALASFRQRALEAAFVGSFEVIEAEV